MTEVLQDLFISHASADKSRYVQPLVECLTARNVTFWLDTAEIGWGDSVPLRINEGLRNSRFVLLCLSKDFLGRNWPEVEMGAALAVQNEGGQKRVLPLVLNSKTEVLARYPILASLAYREYDDPDSLAAELAQLAGAPVGKGSDEITVIIESVHTGRLCHIQVSPRASLQWLSDHARRGLGVSEFADTGGYVPFRVKWVLVDTRVEGEWHRLPRRVQRRLRAIVSDGTRAIPIDSANVRLQDLRIHDGVVFHLYAIEDEEHGPPPAACAPDR